MGNLTMGASLIILILFFSWLVYWDFWTKKRIKEASELGHKLIDFVFEDINDWKEKEKWLRNQPSFEEKTPLGILAPLTTPPLKNFVKGEYEEEFWRWYHEK